ncbi:MAG: chemotaxis protein CheW [Spirulinaceae cyanobacterium]
MLFLLFHVGSERYALDTQSVVEVIPRVNLLPYPGTLPSVAGRFNYQGQILPVLDLSQLLGDEPCPLAWSSRIVIVDLDRDNPGNCLLGLLAERATETLSGDRVQQATEGLNLSQEAYLGDVLLQGQHMIQCLNLDKLLSAASYEKLMAPPDLTIALPQETTTIG